MTDRTSPSNPVAWRVKDYADGWIIFQDEAPARREAELMGGALIQPLYAATPQDEARVADTVERSPDGPSFMQELQGLAAMCESYSRGGAMSAEDYAMLAVRLREAVFVIDNLKKLRDGQAALGHVLVPAEIRAHLKDAADRLLDMAGDIVRACAALGEKP